MIYRGVQPLHITMHGCHSLRPDAATMSARFSMRRRLLAWTPGVLLGAATAADKTAYVARAITVYTFGDSILDCARYNAHGVHPGQLIVRNDDRLFPEFKGRDLHARGGASLEHRAVDGATVDGLPRQARGLSARGDSVALLTIGGNDLLTGLAGDTGPGMKAFERALERFLRDLPIRPVLMGTVYDPTFGDDSRNFLGVNARIARANLGRVNSIIAALAARYGKLVDLHAHFLTGDPSWYTRTIEPSLIGASEVRRAFLSAI
jgi:acyl-CoA thioesterase-1